MQSNYYKITTDGRVIRIRDVSYLTGFSPATIWRKVKHDPGFPRPYKLSQGVTVWDEGEILCWIAAKKTACSA